MRSWGEVQACQGLHTAASALLLSRLGWAGRPLPSPSHRPWLWPPTPHFAGGRCVRGLAWVLAWGPGPIVTCSIVLGTRLLGAIELLSKIILPAPWGSRVTL